MNPTPIVEELAIAIVAKSLNPALLTSFLSPIHYPKFKNDMISLPTPLRSPAIPRQNLPTMYDLPSEHVGEPALPDEFHFLQAMLLMLTFMPPNWEKDMVFSAADLYLYYDANNPRWYKRPDWFGVVGVPRLYEGHDSRLSYVTWQEKVSPFIQYLRQKRVGPGIVRLLSPTTTTSISSPCLTY